MDPAVRELKSKLDNGLELTDDQWRAALAGSGAIRVRSRWPKDVPFAVSMRVPSWLGLTEIRMAPRAPGLASSAAGFLHPLACGTSMSKIRQAGEYQVLGTLPHQTTRLEFDVKIERGEHTHFSSGLTPPPPGVIWAGTMTFPVEAVDSVDAALPPASDPELDAAVRESLGLAFPQCWVDKNAQRRSAMLTVEPDAPGFPRLASTALSLRIEVLDGDRVVETVHLTAERGGASSPSRSSRPNRAFGFAFVKSIPAAAEAERPDLGDLRIRVTGTHDGVLENWDAKHWWNGSLTIPLRDVSQREFERAGADGRQPRRGTPRRR